MGIMVAQIVDTVGKQTALSFAHYLPMKAGMWFDKLTTNGIILLCSLAIPIKLRWARLKSRLLFATNYFLELAA